MHILHLQLSHLQLYRIFHSCTYDSNDNSKSVAKTISGGLFEICSSFADASDDIIISSEILKFQCNDDFFGNSSTTLIPPSYFYPTIRNNFYVIHVLNYKLEMVLFYADSANATFLSPCFIIVSVIIVHHSM